MEKKMPHEEQVKIRAISWPAEKKSDVLDSFFSRPAFDEKAEREARKILEEVRKDGDPAVARFALKFDGAELVPGKFAAGRNEMLETRGRVSSEFMKAAREAHKRISFFAAAGLKKDWLISTPKGGTVGEQFAPIERVGIYIPAAQAPLVSTALMTVTLAKAAGVSEIVACSPVDASGRMSPHLLFALELSGATEILKIGGVHAIGAMTYGTESIRKVDKIAGPGGVFVTAAKRCVYGHVALDLVAGPSEIAVLADSSAQPDAVAADMLSQAEHGTGFEKTLLVTDYPRLADEVAMELPRQAASLSRRGSVEKVLNENSLIVLANNLDAGMEICNRFAPEHLEIIVREPRKWLKKVRHAGAVFVGPWTPESAGDFAAGPSHVLPTGGSARMFSGLCADDFRKRTSVVSFTRADLQNALPVIEAFALAEDLDAHARSARIRFKAK